MYKALAALSVVLGLTGYAAVKMTELVPEPIANEVIAEKSGKARGGQAAVLLPKTMSNDQHSLLNQAYEIAKADGHKNPELVQAVLLQETAAGGLKSYNVAGTPGDQYYGLGQIKLGAAREVMNAYPILWAKHAFHTRTDQELIANLILNKQFNMQVASKYLMILHKRYGFSGRQLMNAYNRGPGGVQAVDDSWHYALGAEKKLAAFKAR